MFINHNDRDTFSYFTVAAAIVVVFLVASWITTAVITLHTEHIPT